MAIPQIRLLTVLAVCSMTTHLHAADLAHYKAEYQVSIKRIVFRYEAKLGKVHTRYGIALQKLIEDVQSTGDLEKTLIVQNEIKRFQAEKTISLNPDHRKVEGLGDLQHKFLKLKSELEEDKAKETTVLIEDYDTKLEGLQKELVKAGKLEDAMAVQEERKRVQSTKPRIKSVGSNNPKIKTPVRLELAHRFPIQAMAAFQDGVAFSSDGSICVAGDFGGNIYAWSTRSRTLKWRYKEGRRIGAVDVSRRRGIVLVSTLCGRLKIRDLDTGELIREFPKCRHAICTASVDPKGRFVVSADNSGKVRVWSTGGKQITQFSADKETVEDILIDEKGRELYTAGGRERKIKRWNPYTGKLLARYDGHIPKINCVMLTDYNDKLIGCSSGGDIIIWDSDHEKPISRLMGHTGVATSGITIQNGNYLISGSFDGTIRIWDLDSKRCVSIHKAGGRVRALAVSSDEKLLLAGCQREVRLYRVARQGVPLK